MLPIFKKIDNFLSNKDFIALNSEIRSLYSKGLSFEHSTDIENQKSVISLNKLPKNILTPISLIGGSKGKNLIRDLTGWKGKIISLIELKDFGGYAPFHCMRRGGFLGSHIDHTFADKGKLIHIGNCIFYSVDDWKKNWGGETCFYNNWGFRVLKKIKPKKNRLLAFVHDCESFHGVNFLKCPSEIMRTTIYMDYYIRYDDLIDFQASFKNKNNQKFKHFNCLTTFIPFGQNGNFIKSILSVHFLGYLKIYLRYLYLKICNCIYWKQGDLK